MNDLAYGRVSGVGQSGVPAPRASATAMTKTIPFDYVFELNLLGQKNNRVQDVVPVSIEGVYVATSVGYSLVPDESRKGRFVEPVLDSRTLPPRPVLITGGEVRSPGDDPGNVPVPFVAATNESSLEADGPKNVLIAGAPGHEVIVLRFPPFQPDLETGVGGPSLDNLEPSVAANRGRPSAPQIVLRTRLDGRGLASASIERAEGLNLLAVWDRNTNAVGGKVALGSSAQVGPNPQDLRLPAEGDRQVFIYGAAGARVRLHRVRDEVEEIGLAANGGDVLQPVDFLGVERLGRLEAALGRPLRAGELLVAQDISASFPTIFSVPSPQLSEVPLGAFQRGLEAVGSDLTDGLRLNPDFANRQNASLPFGQISQDVRQRLFETGCTASSEVSFLYSIDVVSTGRELQSQAIHNIAGLGVANGDRPFRPFAKPFVIEPRSSVRIQVQEISGPSGKLYIVLHGYKTLGTASVPR